MALIECKFFSEILGEATAMFVIIPTAIFGDSVRGGKMSERGTKARYQTLYLLHGLSDDYSSWLRYTSIERYAQQKYLAVVMPAAGKSFYADMKHGSRYWTFISEEVPRVARSLFPLSAQREDNFVAGASMGGYGAFKLALRKPESFMAAASLSGAADLSNLVDMSSREPALRRLLENIFGDPEGIKGSDNDLFYLMQKLKEENREIPRLYQCCGQQDPRFALIDKFKDFAKGLGVELTYAESPGGHDWSYWDNSIRDVLEWLPLKETTV